MKARNRVLAAKKALADQETALAKEIARLNRERRERQDPSEDLRRILARYRQNDVETTVTASDAKRSTSFSQRMSDAVRAHEELVDRISRITRNKK